ncbi:MAG: hypothetical protein HY985_10675 [Magnetospirillum sp.]|nr:hypothetical protein [Magnetospirillum sp.]
MLPSFGKGYSSRVKRTAPEISLKYICHVTPTGAAMIKRKAYKEKQLTRFHEIVNANNDVLVIHYSCESYFDTRGSSPHINAIAVKSLHSGQTKMFSVHREAEIRSIDNDKIYSNYDAIERVMLERFRDFASRHSSSYWVHWRMSDEHYGFEAIERRAEVLGLQPPFFTIPNDKFFGLADFFVTYFGRRYKKQLKMRPVIERNNMNVPGLLYGNDEAEAWRNKKYYDVAVSTQKKVDIHSDMIFLFSEGALLYADSRLVDLARIAKNHPMVAIATAIGALASCAFAVIRLIDIFAAPTLTP